MTVIQRMAWEEAEIFFRHPPKDNTEYYQKIAELRSMFDNMIKSHELCMR